MAKITKLSQHLVNRIAAGEVVERPASVVKELMENSLDADATKITVDIDDGGKKLICVSDDGCGIAGEDIDLVVEPHATSKLTTDEDLFAIHTMGFRGEAMASIASVSQMEITSRPVDAVEGWKLVVAGGEKSEKVPASTASGTVISVRNLFYNTPARRKFLRTSNTEIGHITEQFTRIALAHLHVQLTLTHNGRKLFELPADQTLRDRIGGFFSSDLADSLMPIKRQDRGIEVAGMIAPPQQSRSGSKWQYIFLNGRYIRDRFISHAVRESYRGMMEINRQPVVFLFVRLAPDTVDVNVHPTKIEVRFSDSNVVHSQVLAAIRDKLLGSDLSVNLSSETVISSADQAKGDGSSPAGGGAETDDERKQRIRSAMADFFKNSPPVSVPSSHGDGPVGHGRGDGQYSSAGDYKSVGPVEAQRGRNNVSSGNVTSDSHLGYGDTEPADGSFLQVHNSYIVQQSSDGLVIIDQHALHERILYEELCRQLGDGPLASQRYLIPEVVDVTAEQMAVLDEQAEVLEQLGIALEQFAPGSVAVQAFPVLLEKLSPATVVADLLDMMVEHGGQLPREELTHSVLDMMACKAAVKAGDTLDQSEIKSLLAKRGSVERSGNCPHGRPTTVRLTLSELGKLFKRG